MMNKIDLAPKFTSTLRAAGGLKGVEMLDNGSSVNLNGIRSTVHVYKVLFDTGKDGLFVYYRRRVAQQTYTEIVKREYVGPPPTGYYPDESEVHLVYVDGQGRKDKFTDIPFP